MIGWQWVNQSFQKLVRVELYCYGDRRAVIGKLKCDSFRTSPSSYGTIVSRK
jgi:hypothetical protein